ncbi:hypothetical protein, conserved [Eimeria brunetti]|uniref:Transmembrane protein n=1 Tax=Eimeria brunetti TaxID=51314 RepID=U6LQM4_9EIME|nr:hypothetical protein, conserved [Eimeria brunetti]
MLQAKGGDTSSTGCDTGVFESKEKIPSFSPHSFVFFGHTVISQMLSTRRWKSLRIARPSLASPATLAVFLGLLILRAGNVAGAAQAGLPPVGVETVSMGWSTVTEDQWPADGFLGGQVDNGGGTTLTQSALTGIRSLDADSAFHTSDEQSEVQYTGASVENEGGNAGKSPAKSGPKGGQAGRQGLRLPLSAYALLLLFVVGLPTILFIGSSAWGKKEGAHSRRFDQQLNPDDPKRSTAQQQEDEGQDLLHERRGSQEVMDRCAVVLRELEDLQRLKPLAAHLAKLVNTGEAFRSLQEFGEEVKAGTQVQQKLLAGFNDFKRPPDTLLEDAVTGGLFALSRVYEEAREQGVTLAQKTRSTLSPAILSKEEQQTLGSCVSTTVTGVLDFYFQDANRSFKTFIHIVDTVRKRLERIRGIEGVSDWHVVATVAAGLEFIKEAHNAAEEEAKSFDSVKKIVDEVVMLHYLREQTAMQRRLRDTIDEQRVLCSLEKWREMSQSTQDNAAAVSRVEQQLEEAERLLQKHQKEIDKMKKERDLTSVQGARQQAEALADELKNLLVGTSAYTDSFPRIEEAEEDDHEVQLLMQTVASRAKQAAAVALKRVANIQKEMKLQPSMRGGDGLRTISPSAKEAVRTEMQKLARSTEEVVRQATSAAQKIAKGAMNTPASMAELVKAARIAASQAEAYSKEAEVLRLQMKLLECFDQDMRMSAEWARKAAAAVGIEADVSEMSDYWRLSLSSQQTKKFQSLLEQVYATKKDARLRVTLQDLAAAAGAMKEASLGLVSIAQGQDGTNLNPPF